MRDIWYIKDNKRTKEINKKEIVDNQFRKNLRKGGTDRQKDNIVSFIKDVIYKWNQDNLKSLKTAYLRTYPQEYQKVKKYKDLENPVSVWSYDEKYDQDERENTR